MKQVYLVTNNTLQIYSKVQLGAIILTHTKNNHNHCLIF
jgi:hypothetical protein